MSQPRILSFFCFFLLLTLTQLSCAGVVFETLDGRVVPIKALAGKQIVINYWAEWCQPCLEEIQALNKFYRHNQKKVALFAVNYDSPPISVQKNAVKTHHIEYPSLATNPAKMLQLGSVAVVPATFIFNSRGRLTQTLYGPQTVESLSKALQ